jgi:hypothetical protein
MRRGLGLLLVTCTLASWYAFAGESSIFAPEAERPRSERAAPVRAGEAASDVPPLETLAPHGSLNGGFPVVGTASCASTNCHGGDRSGRNRPRLSVDGHRQREDNLWGGEYAIWLHRDPHARAHSVLFDPRSVAMAENLGLGAAHEADRCLNCHAVNVQPPVDDLLHADQPSLADGVGCEACHGPAGEWLDLHKQFDWGAKSPEQKASHGFWNLDDVLTRTRVCVSCHVGGPGRDVDHDLIAAGHPRLNFEMSAYQALLPHHWSEAANLATSSPAAESLAEFEAKSWAVGQAVAAEAALDQTARRAAAVVADDPHAVWPEFSEYGCFSCHHDLSLEIPLGRDDAAGLLSWRQSRGFGNRRAGTTPWSTWPFAVLPTVARDPGLTRSLAAMRDLMERPVPDARRVALVGIPLRQDLVVRAQRVNGLAYPPEVRAELRRSLIEEANYLAHEDWDSATQAWLGLAALERAESLDGGGNEALKATLVRIRDHLEFPRPPRHFSSPRDHGERIEQLRADFDRLSQLVGPGE